MDLQQLIAKARQLGNSGVVVWSNDGKRYIAGCTNRQGTICDPRSWDVHDTVADVLVDLNRQLDSALTRVD